MIWVQHEYVDRDTGEIRKERLAGDLLLRFVIPENAGVLYRLLTSCRLPSTGLAWWNFDLPLPGSGRRFARRAGIDLSECCDDIDSWTTARQVFERRIKYWDCRPMPGIDGVVVSPCDARILVGSLAETSALLLKGKFFDEQELFGREAEEWRQAFSGGDFAVLRLTPDKYHFNHTPAAGEVVDFYSVEGKFHSCNPGAVVRVVTPCSKNRRVVTIIDTDVSAGSGVGLVAMVEIAALMIGEIVQCYSTVRYEDAQPICAGKFVERGAPKSLFRPGSSTVVLLFQKGRVEFAADIVANLSRPAASRFSSGFAQPLLETDVKVRSAIAYRRA